MKSRIPLSHFFGMLFLAYISVLIIIMQESEAPANPLVSQKEDDSQTFNSQWDWPQKQLEEMGFPFNNTGLRNLPSAQELLNFVGKSPVIFDGTDSININDQCSEFRRSVHGESDRWIGVAGLFNTGTNLLFSLLRQNCIMPIDQRATGIRWQVPWGKHTFADNYTHNTHTYEGVSFDRDHILTVVTTRDPYEWGKSMCRNPYIVKWNERTSPRTCPNLASTVDAWGTHENLMHFWNTWHRKYLENFPYSKIVVRVEDLTLRPRETIKEVCSCAGGTLVKQFRYVVDNAKHGHGHADTSTGMVKAWSRFHWPREARAGLPVESYKIATESIDKTLMNLFGYTHPPPV